MSTWLRIFGIGLNTLGAMILAFRVKGILDVLVEAQQSHENNFRVLAGRLNGERQVVPMVLGMDEHVARAQKAGIWLLVLGFSLLAIGNFLVGLSWYLGEQGAEA